MCTLRLPVKILAASVHLSEGAYSPWSSAVKLGSESGSGRARVSWAGHANTRGSGLPQRVEGQDRSVP